MFVEKLKANYLKNNAVLKADFMAGIIVALVLIPQALAYANLAGLPVKYGLYTAVIPCILAALFGSSKYLSTGPVALISVTCYSIIAPLSSVGSDNYIILASILCLLSGLFVLVFAFLRIDKIITKIDPVIFKSFTNAIGVFIIFTQFRKILNFKSDMIFGALLEIDFIFFVIAGVLIFLLRKLIPKLPAIPLVIILLSFLSYIISFYGIDLRGVGNVNNIFSLELHFFAIKLKDVINLLPGAFFISLLSTIEVYSAAKIVAEKNNDFFNLKQELIGQGITGILSSFVGCYPASGSFSRTALNFTSGARTKFSSIVAGVAVIVLVQLMGRFFVYLPFAVLHAVIVCSVIKLIDFRIYIKCYNSDRKKFYPALFTLIITLLLPHGFIWGIVIGFLFSLIFKVVDKDYKFIKKSKVIKIKSEVL